MKTYAATVQASLIEAGFVIEKNDREGMWEIKDDTDVLMRSRSLGDLLTQSAKELGV